MLSDSAVAVEAGARRAIKRSYNQQIEDQLQKKQSTYAERYGSVGQQPGSAAWEVGPGSYVCHVTKTVFSTAGQLANCHKRPTFEADLQASGLVLVELLLQQMQEEAAQIKEELRIRRLKIAEDKHAKKIRNSSSLLLTTSYKAATACLAGSLSSTTLSTTPAPNPANR